MVILKIFFMAFLLSGAARAVEVTSSGAFTVESDVTKANIQTLEEALSYAMDEWLHCRCSVTIIGPSTTIHYEDGALPEFDLDGLAPGVAVYSYNLLPDGTLDNPKRVDGATLERRKTYFTWTGYDKVLSYCCKGDGHGHDGRQDGNIFVKDMMDLTINAKAPREYYADFLLKGRLLQGYVAHFLVSDPEAVMTMMEWDTPSARRNGVELPPSEIGGYLIEYERLDGSEVIHEVVIPDGSANSKIEEIPAGTYQFRIFTQDAKGLMSDPSPWVTATILPESKNVEIAW